MTDATPPKDDIHPLSALSHELRTPLNAIAGYAEALALGTFGPLPAPLAAPTTAIRDAAEHLNRLIDDLRDIGEVESGYWRPRRESFDPAEVTREVVGLLAPGAAARGVSLDLSVLAITAPVTADPRAWRQVLINLIENGVTATAAGGTLRIEVEVDGETLDLRVRDPGGASDRREGSGIGLRLVKTLCAQQGGAFTLELQPIGGSVARAVWPVAKVDGAP